MDLGAELFQALLIQYVCTECYTAFAPVRKDMNCFNIFFSCQGMSNLIDRAKIFILNENFSAIDVFDKALIVLY